MQSIWSSLRQKNSITVKFTSPVYKFLIPFIISCRKVIEKLKKLFFSTNTANKFLNLVKNSFQMCFKIVSNTISSILGLE